MRNLFYIFLFMFFCVTLSACDIKDSSVNTESRYNSQRMDKIKNQYSDKMQKPDEQDNSKYSYENNVLKIDMK